MNNVIVTGRLVRDSQAYGTSDKLVIRNTIAVDGYQKGADKKTADFIPLVAFGRTAEFMQKYTKKGTSVVVRGHLHSGTYEKDGVKRSTLDVIVDNVEFGQGNNKAADSAPAAAAPAPAPAPTPAPTPASAYEDEELPF